MIDSVVADAEYSPNSGVAIASSTIKRGTAVLNVTGTAKPRKDTTLAAGRQHTCGTMAWRWIRTCNWRMHRLPDVLQIAGQQSEISIDWTRFLYALMQYGNDG